MSKKYRINKIVILTLFAVILIAMAGCQQDDQLPKEGIEESGQRLVPAVPFSKGPTSPPSVKGPDSSPSTAQPQAVTEVEQVQYSLPTGTVPEFKQ